MRIGNPLRVSTRYSTPPPSYQRTFYNLHYTYIIYSDRATILPLCDIETCTEKRVFQCTCNKKRFFPRLPSPKSSFFFPELCPCARLNFPSGTKPEKRSRTCLETWILGALSNNRDDTTLVLTWTASQPT